MEDFDDEDEEFGVVDEKERIVNFLETPIKI